MELNRRQLVKMLGASFVISAIENSAFGNSFLGLTSSEIVMPRMPLDEFVADPRLLDALRQAVKEMKKRKPSDPLSWFYQAAIHGVTDEAIAIALKEDPNVAQVLKQKIWNQCPHNGQNSANFLPWHRAYTYHFERILRLHSGITNLSLPYWNYMGFKNAIGLDFDFQNDFELKRTFPKEFGIQHLDGNMDNNDLLNINPLYHEERDFYFTNYEHPFSTGLPLAILSKGAVDISKPLNSNVFFGETETDGIGGGILDVDTTTRGLLEKYPHDQIHRVVGGIVKDPTTGKESVGGMANPPTAAFDPIFPIHHCSVDLIWVKWSCMPNKIWGKLPDETWFNEKPWLFTDIDGSFVNEPRKNYFDHRALGTRYKYEDLSITPLTLPEISMPFSASTFKFKPVKIKSLTLVETTIIAESNNPTIARVPLSDIKGLQSKFNNTLESNKKLLLTLKDVQLGLVYGTGFNVYLTDELSNEFLQDKPSFIGSIVLFSHDHSTMIMAHDHENHGNHHVHNAPNPQTFDISRAMKGIGNLDNLNIVIQPFSLVEFTTDDKRQNTETLKIIDIEIFKM